jgi:hypothetical protein
MIARLMRSSTIVLTDWRLRVVGLTACYLAVLVALFVLATIGAFKAPSFVYQGF